MTAIAPISDTTIIPVAHHDTSKSFDHQNVNLSFNEVSFSISIAPTLIERLSQLFQRSDNQPLEEHQQNTGVKQILKPASGSFKSGELVCIMGSSGCGKSTILDILANQKTLPYDGEISINGVSRKQWPNKARHLSSYIAQKDVHHSMLTVRENLLFASRMSHGNETNEQHNDRVDTLLCLLGLTECADTLVGSDLKRGISGGQSRRLMVARGLIKNPSILFLDEPTSGLSSTDSETLISRVKSFVVQTNALAIAVIHQPRPSVLAMFDKIVLMCQGNVVFQGGLMELQQFFVDINRPIPPNENPADFALDVLTAGHPLDGTKEAIEWYSKRSAVNRKDNGGGDIKESFPPPEEFSVDAKPPSSPMRMRYLLQRSFITIKRDVKTLSIQVISCFLQLFIIGLLFLNKDSVDTRPIIVTYFLFTVGFAALDSVSFLIEERVRYLSEKNAGFYSAGEFYLTLSIQHGLISSFKLFISVTIAYFMTGMPSNLFVPTFLILWLTGFTVDSLVHLISCSSETMTSATALCSLLLALLSMLNGLLVNTKTIAGYLVWTLFLSPFYYTFEMLMNVLFRNEDETTREAIIDKFGLKSDAMLRDGLVLMSMAIAAKISTWAVLKWTVKEIK